MAPRDGEVELGSSKNEAVANGSGDARGGERQANETSSNEVNDGSRPSSRKRHSRRDLDEDEQQHSSRRRHHHHRSSGHRHSRRHRHHRSKSRSKSPGSEVDKPRDNEEREGRRSRRHHRSRLKGSRKRHGTRSRSQSESRERRKSRSPSTKAKSRSPERSRSRSRSESKRASGFDVMPAGVPVSQAGVMMQTSSMTQQATRHARRVYVGGLPPLVNEQAIAAFFNQVMARVGGNTYGPGDSVVNVYINQEKRFAFVEMRSVEEASNAIALNGIFFNGISVRVKRPSDYDREVAARLGPVDASPHLNLSAVGLEYRSLGPADGPDRIFVGGLPYDWGEQDLRSIMEKFGPLRGLEIVKDTTTGCSKGYGFVVFQDPSLTDKACQSLNSTRLGDKVLTVRRATANGQAKPDLMAALSSSFFMGQQPEQETDIPTKVVCLANAVSPEELRNDAEYTEIVEDMMEECGKYGELQRVEIPRPGAGGEDVPGLGKVFLEFKDVTAAIKAKCNLGGRKFAGNTVEARYYPENRFAVKDYSF